MQYVILKAGAGKKPEQIPALYKDTGLPLGQKITSEVKVSQPEKGIKHCKLSK